MRMPLVSLREKGALCPRDPRDMGHVSRDLGVSEVVWVLSCWLEVPLPDIKHPPLDLQTLLMLNWRSSGGLSQGMKGRLSFNLLSAPSLCLHACLCEGAAVFLSLSITISLLIERKKSKRQGEGVHKVTRKGDGIWKKPVICLRGWQEKERCVLSCSFRCVFVWPLFDMGAVYDTRSSHSAVHACQGRKQPCEHQGQVN